MTDDQAPPRDSINWRRDSFVPDPRAQAVIDQLAADYDDDQLTWIVDQLELVVHGRREAASDAATDQPPPGQGVTR